MRRAAALVVFAALAGPAAAQTPAPTATPSPAPAAIAAAAAPVCPAVTAPSTIVVLAPTGEVACARRPDQVRPIASATKLMTALLALETFDGKMSNLIPAARYRALPVESKINLRAGERLTVADLLRGLLLESANDAAVTLAEGVAGTRPAFVRQMNRRAAALGLTNTQYANPIGLDAPGNHSTARDLAALTLKLREFVFFRKTVDRSVSTLESGDRVRTIANRNVLVRNPRFPWINGVKTGHTGGAGYVLVGSGRRNHVQLVSVVLGANSEAARSQDTLTILRSGFRRFVRVQPVRRGQRFTSVPIRFGRGAALPLVAPRTFRKVVLRSESTGWRKVVEGVPAEVEGPIRRGARLATLVLMRGSDRIATMPLVASADVPAASVSTKTKDRVTKPVTMLVILGILGCTLLVARIRSRARSASSASRAAGKAEAA
jgi:D-alanyl-D-alanine carboxypeptidase (penicillin-binding protein 5/6)